MYFYLPNQRYGTDKVAEIQGDDFQVGAIYEIDGERGVCLGKECAFSELIQPYRRDGSKPTSMHCVFEKVLSEKTITLLHRFVHHRYTTYHKSVPLRLGDIDQLIKRKKTGRKKKGGAWSIATRFQNHENTDDNPNQGGGLTYTPDSKSAGQTLIIFPTMWSLYAHLKDAGRMELTGSIVLHGQLTASAKAKAFREIKSGSIHTVYATYSQLFQDWNDLKKVIVLDQHARWYKNFQEPRYFLPTIVDTLHTVYGCEIVKTGVVLTSR